MADWHYDKIEQLQKKYEDEDLQELYKDVHESTPKNVEELAVATVKHAGTEDSAFDIHVGSSAAMPRSLEDMKLGFTPGNILMGDSSPRRLNQAVTPTDKLKILVLDPNLEECAVGLQVNKKLKMLEHKVHNLMEPIPAPYLENMTVETMIAEKVEELGVHDSSSYGLLREKMVDNDGEVFSESHNSDVPKLVFPEYDNFGNKRLLLDKTFVVK